MTTTKESSDQPIIQFIPPRPINMDDPLSILAGSGGVGLGDVRTSHEGRKAVLLVRDGDARELKALAETMKIEIVEIIHQPGSPDPQGYFGKGRLQDVADELNTRIKGHLWEKVDLVIIHENASPRQLVNIGNSLKTEVWDRVRLLLALFTSHASSVEARTQVRIAQLQADRTVLRELANQQTSGERAGFGAGGSQALQSVLSTVSRELASLRKRQKRHALARRERRRQRSRGGAKTVGLAGYTNAGKSSLFLALSGKDVLIEDKLFSTLETTVGRMELSPRILLADTIGFIDELPSDLLDAFHATLDESLQCDLLLLLADSSDGNEELKRKLATSKREVLERVDDSYINMIVVLTKSDKTTDTTAAIDVVEELGFSNPAIISSHTGSGIEELREEILSSLYGQEIQIEITPGKEGERAQESFISELYDLAIITKREENIFTIWCGEAELNRMISKSNGRILLK
jgi:GTP-binding protein HflX